jgi:hypothetical protein
MTLLLASLVLCLVVAVVRLVLLARSLARERDMAIARRDEANDAMRRMAEDRVFARVRASVVSWVQPGSREAN